jgi:hypothetical protein
VFVPRSGKDNGFHTADFSACACRMKKPGGWQEQFSKNGLEGEFIQSFVGHGHFTIDEFVVKRKIPRLHLLHSDIQGYELEMLDGAKSALGSGLVDYILFPRTLRICMRK